MAPNPDQQIHRDEHDFPERVEEEKIDRQQGSEQSGLQHEHQETELARAHLDIAAPRIEQRERDQDSGEDYYEEIDTVDPDVIRDSELRNPFIVFDELVAGPAGLERSK